MCMCMSELFKFVTDVFVDEFDRVCTCAPIVDPRAIFLLQGAICLLLYCFEQIKYLKIGKIIFSMRKRLPPHHTTL